MPQVTRAKFRCNEVTKQAGWGGHKFVYSYKFSAVTDGSEENKQFFTATPSGSVSLSALRDDFFEVGQEYYLDFTLAAAPKPD